jgi:hypothetical protein
VERAVPAVAVNTAAETLLAGRVVEAFAEEEGAGPEVEVAVAVVGATVVNVVEQAVKDLKRDSFEPAFAVFVAFVHNDAMRYSFHMVSSRVHD